MVGKILVLFLCFLSYSFLSLGLCFTGIGRTNPFHKFPISVDSYDGSKNVELKSVDDKYFFFILVIIWPLLVLFYYIPKGLFKVFKFLLNFIGWCIAKIFKL